MSVTLRKPLRNIPSYVPARSLHSVEEELGVNHIVKLAANENNLGCSPKVAASLAASAAEIARYPDYTNTELLKRLTVKHGVKDDELIFSDGSFELISLIAQTYFEPGDESIVADPSFIWYQNVTMQSGATLIKVPLTDYSVDLGKLAVAITPKTKIIWICNPNNPTGSMLDHEDILEFLQGVRKDILVVLDEAYLDFARSEHHVDSVEFIHTFDNVIALRTFSKLYGLASLRLGYGIASSSIIRQLYSVKQPFNVNFAAQVAAVASLDDTEFPQKVLENNCRGLERYYRTLDELGLRYVPSNGNFILFDTGYDSDEMVAKFLKRGILIRGGKEFGLPTWLRITIGTPEENILVLKTLYEILSDGLTTAK